MDALKVSVTGTEQAIATLKAFGNGVYRRQVKIALSAAGGVLKPEAEKRAPRDTDSLAKTIGVKTKLGRKKDYAYTIISAKRRVKYAIGDTKKKKNAKLATFKTVRDKATGDLVTKATGEKRLAKATAAGTLVRYRTPARYIHFAEDQSGFLAEATAAKKDAAAQKLTAKLAQGVEEERRKASK